MHSHFQRFHRSTSSNANIWQMLPANAVRDLTHALNTSVARCRTIKSLELWTHYYLANQSRVAFTKQRITWPMLSQSSESLYALTTPFILIFICWLSNALLRESKPSTCLAAILHDAKIYVVILLACHMRRRPLRFWFCFVLFCLFFFVASLLNANISTLTYWRTVIIYCDCDLTLIL